MSVNPPPSINTSIFNPAFFQYANSTALTLYEADKRYLKLSGGVLTGLLTTSAGINVSSSSVLSLLNIAPSTSSTTGALQCAGGAYFGAACIFNSGVKIPTGASNGYVLSSDASGNASWVSSSSVFTGFTDGSVASPGAYFTNQTSTGFYRNGSGIYFTCAGVDKASITSTQSSSAVPFVITDGTAATGTSNVGALQVSGGAYIEKNSFLNNNLTLQGTNSVLSLTSSVSYISLSNVNPSTSSSTGALRCFGGGYFGALSTFNSTINLTGAGSTTISTGTLYSLPATVAYSGSNTYFYNYFAQPPSSGSSTGAAYTVYIADQPTGISNPYAFYVASGRCYLGGAATMTSDVTISGASSIVTVSGASSYLTLSNTAASTSSGSGALRCSGGIYAGAASLFNGNISTNASVKINNGANIATVSYNGIASCTISLPQYTGVAGVSDSSTQSLTFTISGSASYDVKYRTSISSNLVSAIIPAVTFTSSGSVGFHSFSANMPAGYKPAVNQYCGTVLVYDSTAAVFLIGMFFINTSGTISLFAGNSNNTFTNGSTYIMNAQVRLGWTLFS